MKDVFDELVNRIKRKEVIYFLGAGASVDAPASLPASLSLFEHFSEMFFPNPVIKSNKRLLSFLRKRFQFEVFFQSFTDVFKFESIGLLKALEGGQPNYNHLHIGQLASKKILPAVVTTNFDSLKRKQF